VIDSHEQYYTVRFPIQTEQLQIIMLSRIFRQTDIPKKYHSNFIHLYFDIAWFGVLSGSAVNFLNVYAARLGATSLQIGLIGAMSAVVSLFLALPAGRWLEGRHTGRAVFWSSVVFRAGYLLWIPLPLLFDAQGQILALILVTFLMAIPLAPLSVGFNALFAEAVPERYRAQVAGIRNVSFAIAYMLTSLVSGFILKNAPFPGGYIFIFGIGAFGAAMSSLHLRFVKPLKANVPAVVLDEKPKFSLREMTRILRPDVLTSPFGFVLLALFAFHLSHNLTNAVYPLYNVRELRLNDNHIGIGTALYYLTVTVGSTFFRRIAHRLGHKRTTGWGVVGMAVYPFFLALSRQVWQFYAVSFVGGFTWALVGGAYANYMLERIPQDDRPAHLAWYNVVLNLSILVGLLGGASVADRIGLVSALILFAALRVLAGIFILKWG
jgi:MFS family permease